LRHAGERRDRCGVGDIARERIDICAVTGEQIGLCLGRVAIDVGQ
jgi:hypothetical protein